MFQTIKQTYCSLLATNFAIQKFEYFGKIYQGFEVTAFVKVFGIE